MEIFKECNFSDKYLIGNNGTVKRLDKAKIKRYNTDLLVGLIKPDGYKMYFLCGKWYYAHRLVAFHYLDNPNNWNEVNHIDGNKLNNYYLNLEFSTRKLNIKHSYDVLNRKKYVGIENWNYGKSPSQQTKKLMSDKKIGENHPKFKGWYIYNGIEYTSANQLGEVNNIAGKTVKKYAMNNLYGYSFKSKNLN